MARFRFSHKANIYKPGTLGENKTDRKVCHVVSTPLPPSLPPPPPQKINKAKQNIHSNVKYYYRA